MQLLNFPAYDFRVKNKENKILIFDIIRKKFVVLQPEEWVRQHVIRWLIEQKKFPASLINVEKKITINGLTKRYDIVVFTPNGSIELLVECKAYTQRLSQEVFDQVARYNLQIRARYLMLTNGLQHYFCKLDLDEEKYAFLEQIPDFRR